MGSHDDKERPEHGIDEVYEQLEEDLAKAYPNNPEVRETVREVLGDLKDENSGQ